MRGKKPQQLTERAISKLLQGCNIHALMFSLCVRGRVCLMHVQPACGATDVNESGTTADEPA
jgi:hypothetical protein